MEYAIAILRKQLQKDTAEILSKRNHIKHLVPFAIDYKNMRDAIDLLQFNITDLQRAIKHLHETQLQAIRYG